MPIVQSPKPMTTRLFDEFQTFEGKNMNVQVWKYTGGVSMKNIYEKIFESFH